MFRKKASPVRRSRVRSDSPKNVNYTRLESQAPRLPGRQISKSLETARGNYWLRRSGFFVLLCVGVVSLVNVVVLKPSAKVEPLVTDQHSFLLHSKSEYQTTANRILASSFLSRTKLTVSTSRLSRELLSQYPELASVHTTLPLLGHKPIVYIETAQPALLMHATNGDYVLDNRGKALLRAADVPASADLQLSEVQDLSGLKVQLNHQIITPANVTFIQTVVTQLASRHYKVSSMTLPPAASQLDVHLVGQGYTVKFNLQNNTAREQAGTFLATANYLKGQKQTPGEYIDVRVDGRAYYK